MASLHYLAATLQGSTGHVSLESVLLPLTAALGMALVVERVVEFLKNLVDIVPTTANAAVVEPPEAAAKELRKLTAFHEAADNPDEEWPETLPPETIIVQDATDPDQGQTLRGFVIQTVAVITGILAAHVSGLQLFHALAPNANLSTATDFLLTGLFIGGGSGPVHVLIRFVTERKVAVTEEPARAEVASGETVLVAAGGEEQRLAQKAAISVAAFVGPVSAATSAALDIPYSGGVDRDRLQSVHRRDRNPDLIVFHHTAMPLSSTFEDVVRVIKNREDSSGKKWITGYNCVVTSDGGIHPFCRWDRYGNHAQGFNKRSLGITLNGNFETDRSVPYSNPDGRYGAPRPTEPQLDAAARVVALWLFLYPDIPLVFDQPQAGIVPHKNVSPKTCPGNMFPTAQFERLIRHYHGAWASSPDARARIDAYRLRPYLYVDAAVIPPSRIVPPISMGNLQPGTAPVQPGV